jgi:hypothetical protein
MFPPRPRPLEDDTHPWLPALHKRDVETKRPVFNLRGFWITTAAITFLALVAGSGNWKSFSDFLATLIGGAFAGAILGVAGGFVGGMIASTHQVLVADNPPPDEKLGKILTDPERGIEIEETRPDPNPNQSIRPSSPDLHPGDRP